MENKLPLTQFFKDAKSGRMGLKLVENDGRPVNSVICPVIKVHTRNVELLRGTEVSILDLDYASLVDYNRKFLCVYAKGKNGTRGSMILKYQVCVIQK